jgi:uncharacterized protein YdhG (YjbR/CyaY superfamily)
MNDVDLRFTSVDDYIDSQPAASRGTLVRVRAAIRKAVPEAEETISYNIPTYKLHGSRLLFFAGWRKFYSLYPATDNLLAAFQEDLTPYEINKHTLRFPFSQPVPAKLIERIAKFRAKEVVDRTKPNQAISASYRGHSKKDFNLDSDPD